MARESWWVDGWEITNGLSHDVEVRTGLYSTPAPVGSNGVVANRTGELWRPKKHGPGKFTLSLWGAPTAAGRAAVEALWDDMIRAFSDPSRLLTFRRVLASGEERECKGEVVAAMSPTPIGQKGYRVGVEVSVPAGYWRGTALVSNEVALTGSGSAVLPLTNFAGSTAPLENLLIDVRGGLTNIRLTDITNEDIASTGEWLSYNGTIPDGASLSVNTENWQVAAFGTGDGVFRADLGRVAHSGGRLFTVGVARPGKPLLVRATYANVIGSPTLRITGRKAFQV